MFTLVLFLVWSNNELPGNSVFVSPWNCGRQSFISVKIGLILLRDD